MLNPGQVSLAVYMELGDKVYTLQKPDAIMVRLCNYKNLMDCTTIAAVHHFMQTFVCIHLFRCLSGLRGARVML